MKNSERVYVSGCLDPSIQIVFNPSGGYRSTDSFNYSSRQSSSPRPGLHNFDSFAQAHIGFGAELLGFDAPNDSSANMEEGLYAYLVELTFCETAGQKEV